MGNIDDRIYSQTIKLGDEVYQVGDLFHISLETISDEFANQSARMAYIGMLLAQAEVAYDEARAIREEVYADEDLGVREKWEAAGVKFTESKVKAMVLLAPDYQVAADAEREALSNFKLLRVIYDALRQRGEMLISLGAHLRQEFDMTGMSMKMAVQEKRRGRTDD